MVERLLTKQEAADFLGVTISCLNDWHARGIGPVRTPLGSQRVRYAIADIESWLAAAASGKWPTWRAEPPPERRPERETAGLASPPPSPPAQSP